MSGRAIDNNAKMAYELDLNAMIATLICILREQYWDGCWTDTIGPRISSGNGIPNKLYVVFESISELILYIQR